MLDMLRIKKKDVQNLLSSFGSKASVDVEHKALMEMLGAPMDEEYGEDEEQGYAMPMNKMGKQQGPKMMALRAMLGKES
jgi:hypothetical protein